MSTSRDDSATAVLETATTNVSRNARTILLLDPVELFLRFEETVLHRKEWRILGATTAHEALELLETETVNLIIMDHALPDMPGAEVIEKLRADPRNRATGILVLTARGVVEQVDRCRDAGCNGVLFKPVSRQVLCARVEDLLHVSARRHVRTMVRLQVDARAEGRFFFGETVNLSSSGMLLEARDLELEVGDVLALRFNLPGTAGALTLNARVVRSDNGQVPGTTASGLVFEGLDSQARASIEEFVTQSRASLNPDEA